MGYEDLQPLEYTIYEDEQGRRTWYLYLPEYSDPTQGTLLGLRYRGKDDRHEFVHIPRWTLKKRHEVNPLPSTLFNFPMLMWAVDNVIGYYRTHDPIDTTGKEFCVRVVKELYEEYNIRCSTQGTYHCYIDYESFEEICEARPPAYRRVLDAMTATSPLKSILKQKSSPRGRRRSRDGHRSRRTCFWDDVGEEEYFLLRDLYGDEVYSYREEGSPRRGYYMRESDFQRLNDESPRSYDSTGCEGLSDEEYKHLRSESRSRVKFETIERHHSPDGSYYECELGNGRVRIRVAPDGQSHNNGTWSYN